MRSRSPIRRRTNGPRESALPSPTAASKSANPICEQIAVRVLLATIYQNHKGILDTRMRHGPSWIVAPTSTQSAAPRSFAIMVTCWGELTLEPRGGNDPCFSRTHCLPRLYVAVQHKEGQVVTGQRRRRLKPQKATQAVRHRCYATRVRAGGRRRQPPPRAPEG